MNKPLPVSAGYTHHLVIPTVAKRSGGTCCFVRPQHLFIPTEVESLA